MQITAVSLVCSGLIKAIQYLTSDPMGTLMALIDNVYMLCCICLNGCVPAMIVGMQTISFETLGAET